jgi:N-acetylglucosaminyldiphosphoundecaprenol N-acetyl-beta-D-mannosaminyltransferase
LSVAADRTPVPQPVRSTATGRLPVVDIHGVPFHAITEAQCVNHVLDELDAGRGGMLVTPNLDYVNRCKKEKEFARMVLASDLIVPDGMPLIWASRLQGTPLPERVAGSNLISSLPGGAAARGRTIFLLGGAPGTAEGSAEVLRKRFPSIKILGTHCPPLGFEKDAAKLQAIDDAVLTARPDLVLVALGAPKQERMVEHLQKILPLSWHVGVGNSFSFLSGDVQRAPVWMQKSGLEWLHRIIQEPGRLWKRYLIVGIPFAGGLLLRAAARGISNRLGRRHDGALQVVRKDA